MFDESTRRVQAEAESAHMRFNGFNSTHEALGVLIEEVDELKAAIHENNIANTSHEAMQVSAVALRLYDLCERAMRGDAEAFKVRSGA